MIFSKEYQSNKHITYILNLLLYTNSVEFVNGLASDVVFNNDGNLESSCKVTCDIIKYSILTDKIIIKHSSGKIFNKDNYDQIIELLENNFNNFLNLKNGDFPYHYSIIYTEAWKIELLRM
jgi:hypothetical protein